jgi:hypothetical protein
MNFSHDFNEKSSFELTPGRGHILAHSSDSTRKARLQMYKAYPLYLAPRDERHSSNRGIFSWFFGLLFGTR